MNEKIPENVRRVAAKWWADKLRGPVKFDIGGKSPSGVMAEAMAAMDNVRAKRPDDKALAIFEQALVDAMAASNFYGRIAVDYHPDVILQEAAKAAGIPLRMASLPWKTRMRVGEDFVEVAEGYGAQSIRLPL